MPFVKRQKVTPQEGLVVIIVLITTICVAAIAAAAPALARIDKRFGCVPRLACRIVRLRPMARSSVRPRLLNECMASQ